MLVKRSHSRCMLSGTQLDTEHNVHVSFLSFVLAGWLEWFCVDFLLTCYVGTEEWISQWLESCGQHYCRGITAGQSGCITMTSCQKDGFTSQWLVRNMALCHSDFLSETWLFITVTCQKHGFTSEWLPQDRSTSELHHNDFLWTETWLYITMTPSRQKHVFMSEWLLLQF